MKTFSGDSSPSLADLDANFAELARMAAFLGPQIFGAKCDLVPLLSASISAGSNVFDSADAVFTGDDIGKHIAITGAGVPIGTAVTPDAATLYGPLVTTITGINSTTQVTLAAAASRTVGSGVGIQYVSNQNATVELSAKAFYGSDDTSSLQAYVDYAHRNDGIVRIPNPGCMVLGTVYCQTSRALDRTGLIWRRLEFRGVGPTSHHTSSGIAVTSDSNLFKPTAGPILAVNLDAAGAGMTSTGSTYNQIFGNFITGGIAYHGMPGVATVGLKLHCTRAQITDALFCNLACGWDGLTPDVNGAINYCDQWTVGRVKFANCGAMFKQGQADGTEWGNLYAESHYPTIVNAIELLSGRGWKLNAPLINSLPSSARVGLFTNCRAGKVVNGHFEHIYGNGFTVDGDKYFVDFESCDFYSPFTSLTAGLTADTIKYNGAGGRVEGCGFSHKRASGSDIKFGAGRHQIERNNSFFGADNITRRFPSVEIVKSTGNIGTSFRQQYFIEVICYNGTNFDIRNVNGSTMLYEIMPGAPRMDYRGFLNLDGGFKWGRPNMAIAVRKNGKYRPEIVSVDALSIAWYNDSNVLVTTPDTNMNCYLLIS